MLIRFSIPIPFPFHGGHSFRHLYFEASRCPSKAEVIAALRPEDRDCIQYLESAADFPKVDAESAFRIGYCVIGNSKLPLTAQVIKPYQGFKE
jgi:hypothetical protein